MLKGQPLAEASDQSARLKSLADDRRLLGGAFLSPPFQTDTGTQWITTSNSYTPTITAKAPANTYSGTALGISK